MMFGWCPSLQRTSSSPAKSLWSSLEAYSGKKVKSYDPCPLLLFRNNWPLLLPEALKCTWVFVQVWLMEKQLKSWAKWVVSVIGDSATNESGKLWRNQIARRKSIFTADTWGWYWCCRRCPVQSRMCCSMSSLYSLDTSIQYPKNVPQHCQLPPLVETYCTNTFLVVICCQRPREMPQWGWSCLHFWTPALPAPAPLQGIHAEE